MSRETAAGSKVGSTSLTVFQWVDRHHEYLRDTLQQLLDDPGKTLASRCMYLAHQVQKACAKEPVGVMAALQLNRSHPYHYIKELFATVLCELVGKELGMQSSERLYLCCAAMTQDVGMVELQDESLDRQNTPLTPGQKRQVERHLQTGRSILERCGVQESLWVDPFYQHHEQPDGKGYPQGLIADEIHPSAHVLHVVDAYVALIRPRGDRPALLPKDAQRHLFQHRNTQFDTSAVRALAKVLGSYPPGAWVQLANGEVGVVSGIAADSPFPEVSVMIGADQEHLEVVMRRDTAEGRYTIIEEVSPPFHFNLGSLLSSLWPPLD